MTAQLGARDVKVHLDPELAQAIATARKQDRTTSAGFIRNSIIRTLREAGHLAPASVSTAEVRR